jgi:hypothetical protein
MEHAETTAKVEKEVTKEDLTAHHDSIPRDSKDFPALKENLIKTDPDFVAIHVKHAQVKSEVKSTELSGFT